MLLDHFHSCHNFVGNGNSGGQKGFQHRRVCHNNRSNDGNEKEQDCRCIVLLVDNQEDGDDVDHINDVRASD